MAEALVRRAARVDGGGPVVAVAATAAGAGDAGPRLRDARSVARDVRDARPIVTAAELLVDRVLARVVTERDLVRAFADELAPLPPPVSS